MQKLGTVIPENVCMAFVATQTSAKEVSETKSSVTIYWIDDQIAVVKRCYFYDIIMFSYFPTLQIKPAESDDHLDLVCKRWGQ